MSSISMMVGFFCFGVGSLAILNASDSATIFIAFLGLSNYVLAGLNFHITITDYIKELMGVEDI